MNQIDQFLTQDSILKTLIEAIDLNPLSPTHTPFTSLSRSIISQQLSIKAAQSILKRCEDFFGTEFEPPKILNTPQEELRSLGISGRKASYWQNIAIHSQQNPQFWKDIATYPDQKIIDELTQIKGVGVWTVHMLLMFNLLREDIFPIGDLAIRDAMCRLYQIDASKKEHYQKLEQIAKKWSPYRSVASRYLWSWRGMQ